MEFSVFFLTGMITIDEVIWVGDETVIHSLLYEKSTIKTFQKIYIIKENDS